MGNHDLKYEIVRQAKFLQSGFLFIRETDREDAFDSVESATEHIRKMQREVVRDAELDAERAQRWLKSASAELEKPILVRPKR